MGDKIRTEVVAEKKPQPLLYKCGKRTPKIGDRIFAQSTDGNGHAMIVTGLDPDTGEVLALPFNPLHVQRITAAHVHHHEHVFGKQEND